MTNYERITESQESLTGFIREVVECCGIGDCVVCPLKSLAACSERSILKWLGEECNG